MYKIINYETALHAGRSFIAQMHADLRAGDDRSLKAYLSTLGDHHEHGWMNVALIHLQRPRALKVCTREEWLRLGRQIKKNTEPIVLLAPSVATGRPARDDLVNPYGRVPVNNFGSVMAYDIRDTSGHPYPWSIVSPGQINLAIGGLRDLIFHRLSCDPIPLETRDNLMSYQGQLSELADLAQLAAKTLLIERMATISHWPEVGVAEVSLATYSIVSGTLGHKPEIPVLLTGWPNISRFGISLSRVQTCSHRVLDYALLDGADEIECDFDLGAAQSFSTSPL